MNRNYLVKTVFITILWSTFNYVYYFLIISVLWLWNGGYVYCIFIFSEKSLKLFFIHFSEEVLLIKIIMWEMYSKSMIASNGT